MNTKHKLELTWIGKENRLRLEPRILLDDPEKSYHAEHKVTDRDIFDNRLIFGDNLLALKALEQECAGKVKCVFIDPPYNTGSAFEHYDDGVEHSIWLGLMRDRLDIMRSLLADDGSLWMTIDDTEVHYLKVVCDEIFGRKNFMANVIWHSTKSVTNTALISDAHTHCLLFFKDKAYWVQHRNEFRLKEQGSGFANPDNDPRGDWKADPFQVGGWRPNQQYDILNPHTGEIYRPNRGSSWKNDYEKFQELLKDKRIVFGKHGTAGPQRKRFLSEATERGRVAITIWADLDTTTNGTHHSKMLFGDMPFTNPKPENLIERILELSTQPGDLVLDSFAGSGTTGAVAHKMGRRWIMVELGEHCHTHIIPRLKKVIDGEDRGGITEAVGWKGGGGFRYYRLAPSLLEQDHFGNLVISRQYNPAMVAEAMCTLMGFTYAPSETVYWQHGYSTERDFMYVTTQTLTREVLTMLSDEVGEHRSLLVCCGAFRVKPDAFPNVTLKKIPKEVLGRCEWGKDDYSLRVDNLPQAPAKAGQRELALDVLKQETGQ